MIIGVGIPGESSNSIEGFRANYGLADVDFWIDNNNNYRELIEPGGRQFPINVVIDKQGKVVYLANNYVPGEAIDAAKKALAQ